MAILERKFLARAKKKGYKKILLNQVEIVPESEEISASDSERDEEVKMGNREGLKATKIGKFSRW